MAAEVATWHYGLVAKWWAEFNVDGPEIGYFRQMIEQFGQPALDVGCGTGRLLLPLLKAGIDVDGCDVSEDMLDYCRERADRESLLPNLYCQAMHELDLPRKYRSVILCGAFGLGGNRENDGEALRRFYALLEPGGVLILDNYLPYKAGEEWQYWTKAGRAKLPQPWPEAGEPRQASDGAALRLRARCADIDPLDQVATLEMWAEEFRDGKVVAEERSMLKAYLYFRNETILLLERAGFRSVEVQAGYENRQATIDDEILVFIARK